MSKTFSTLFAIFFVLNLFFVSFALADDLDDGPSIDNIPSVGAVNYPPNYPSLYISGNLGYGRVFQPLVRNSITRNRNFVWNGALGIQIIRQFALEGGYIKLPTVVGRNGYRSYVYYVATHLVYQPIGSRYNVFAKIGGADNSRTDKILMLGGVGISYFLSPNLSILAQFIDIPGNDNVRNAMMGLLGLTYFITF